MQKSVAHTVKAVREKDKEIRWDIKESNERGLEFSLGRRQRNRRKKKERERAKDGLTSRKTPTIQPSVLERHKEFMKGL